MTAPGWLGADRRALLRRIRPERAGGPIRPVPRTGPLPLSPAQQRLWFLDQLAPGTGLYNVTGGLWLRGPLDVEALRRAFRAVVNRHEVLGSVFRPDEAGRLVSVPADRAVAVTVTEVPGGRAEALRIAEELAAEPLDIVDGPVLRAALLRRGPQEHLLVLVIHHIVADGWALGVILQDLATAYTDPEGLPELDIQYADYAVWQRDRLASGTAGRQLAYWRGRLAGAQAPRMPTDRPWPQRPTYAGATLTRRMAPRVMAGLRSRAGRHRATPFMAAMAVYASVLSRWSGQTDLTLGAPASGRHRMEIAPLIGCFVNMLPIRLDLSGDPSFGETLDRVRQAVIEAQANGDVPFEEIVRDLRLERDPGGRVPLIRHIVQFDETLRPAPMAGLHLELQALGTGTSKFELFVDFEDGGDRGLECRAHYSTEVFDAETVERFMAELCRAAEAAADENRSLR
ncbi:condensation domain-containing protein [Nonomuraea sp. NPDC004186]